MYNATFMSTAENVGTNQEFLVTLTNLDNHDLHDGVCIMKVYVILNISIT